MAKRKTSQEPDPLQWHLFGVPPLPESSPEIEPDIKNDVQVDFDADEFAETPLMLVEDFEQMDLFGSKKEQTVAETLANIDLEASDVSGQDKRPDDELIPVGSTQASEIEIDNQTDVVSKDHIKEDLIKEGIDDEAFIAPSITRLASPVAFIEQANLSADICHAHFDAMRKDMVNWLKETSSHPATDHEGIRILTQNDLLTADVCGDLDTFLNEQDAAIEAEAKLQADAEEAALSNDLSEDPFDAAIMRVFDESELALSKLANASTTSSTSGEPVDDWNANLDAIFEEDADPNAVTPLISDNLEDNETFDLRGSPVPWGAGGIGVLSTFADRMSDDDIEKEEKDREKETSQLFTADQAVHGSGDTSHKNRLKRQARQRRFYSEHERQKRAVLVGSSVCVILTLVMGGLLYRVGQLQMQPAQPIAERIDKQRSNRTMFGRRGNIVDRRGRLMATSGTAWRLFVDPKLIYDHSTFSAHVGMQLGYDPAEIEKKIFKASAKSRYVVLDEDVELDVRWRLGELRQDAELKNHFKAVNLQKWMKREYPQGTVAGNILGFVGKDGTGLEGVEALYEDHLAASKGRSGYLRDAQLRPLKIQNIDFESPQDGHPVVLSMDVRIQSIAEEELAMTCQAFEAESAQMVIMNPWTGEILAMANHPSFDPDMALDLLAMGLPTPKYEQPEGSDKLDIDALELEDLRQAERVMPWRNRTISEVFEPGSTFKPFIWAALTEGGYATPYEMIDCGPGRWRSSEGRRLKDAHGVGRVDWTTVLVKSSNIGMAIVAERATHEHLHDQLRRFGFGSASGSGLMGEENGLVTSMKNWNHYSQTSVPMGQEIAVTGLQMARALAAIANGGYLVEPTFLKYEADPYLAQPVAVKPVLNKNLGNNQIPANARQILKTKTANLTLRAMREVVLRGTGRKLKDSPFGIFGKTGTAQVARSGIDRKINGPGYEPGAYIACFIGGAPVHNPQVVVVCFVKKPNPRLGYYGGLVAGPAVKKTINRIMPYLGIDKMKEEEEIERLIPIKDQLQASRE